MISVARYIPQAHASTVQGRWDTRGFIGAEVNGKTLGIVGLGTIGTLVARRVKGFNMRVLYYSRTRKPHLERELGVEYVDLETLLRESDFVTIHVDLTEETRGMIGEKELSMMKR
ncbi:D-glycerate dehydrogenase, partial [Candidatus Bathyarchaeota archaeon ex4484_40]